MIVHKRKQADPGRQRPTLDDKGSRSRQSLVAPSTASRHYDNLYKKKWSRHCTKDKTYVGALCSMDLAVVFHLPPPGGCIQAGKLVSPKKNPPSGRRARSSLHGKVCTRAPDHHSTEAPGGTVHFRELIAIFFHRQGRPHHAEANPMRFHRMTAHEGGGGDHGDF
jgi:hypothetical protein